MALRTVIAKSLRVVALRTSSFSASIRTLTNGTTFNEEDRNFPNPAFRDDLDQMAAQSQIEQNQLTLDPTMPDGEPKRKGRILEDMLDALRKKNVEETLNFVDAYSELMNTHHVYRCYGNIQRRLPQLPPEVVENLRKDTRFQKLCVLAGKKATFFGSKHCVYMIRSLVDLGFKPDSILLQMFLELSKHHINDLSITNIAMLGHSLIKLVHTDQINILKQGLALAVDNNFLLELRFLGTDNIIHLFEAFGSLVEEETLNSMIWNLKIRKDSRKFSKPEVVLKAMKECDVFDEDLMRICCEISLDCMRLEIFTEDQLVMVASALSYFEFYSHSTLTAVADYVCERDFAIDFDAKIVHLLMECHYFPTNLVEKLIENVESCDVIDQSLKNILDEIVEDSDGIINNSDIEKLRIRFDFTALEDFEFNNDSDLFRKLQVVVPEFSNNGIEVLIVEKGDYFRNIAKLCGPQFRSLQKMRRKGEKVFVMSEEWLESQPEHELHDLLERKISESETEGFVQLL